MNPDRTIRPSALPLPKIGRVPSSQFETLLLRRWATKMRRSIAVTTFAKRVKHVHHFSLWFSLPLAIWLSSGWMGLLLQWQAVDRIACLPEKDAGPTKLPLAGINFREETPHVL